MRARLVEDTHMGKLPQRILTHPYVDLDAATCVAVLVLQGEGSLDEVYFLPANAAELPVGQFYAVDHPLGLKGDRSALIELPGAVDLLGEEFVQEIDRHDAGELPEDQERLRLSQVFGAFRTSLGIEGLTQEDRDRALLKTWFSFVQGWASMRKQPKRAKEAAPLVPLERVGNYVFAASPRSLPPGTHSVLQSDGVSGFFYYSSRGIGLHRFRGVEKPDLTELADHLPGWFIHPGGFLACWGSNKAPTNPEETPPPEGTPQNMEELISLVKSVFGEDS